MPIQLERRSGQDRRQHHVTFPRAFEHRLNADPREPKMGKSEATEANRVITEGYWGASEDDSSAE